MQLLVLVFMLLMSGKNTDMQQFQPILEGLGGGKAADAFKQAEELTGMLSAVQSLAAMAAPDNNVGGKPCGGGENGCADGFDGGAFGGGSCGCGGNGDSAVGECERGGRADGGSCGGGFPLSPIANIADERITYCLSRYIALGE